MRPRSNVQKMSCSNIMRAALNSYISYNKPTKSKQHNCPQSWKRCKTMPSCSSILCGWKEMLSLKKIGGCDPKNFKSELKSRLPKHQLQSQRRLQNSCNTSNQLSQPEVRSMLHLFRRQDPGDHLCPNSNRLTKSAIVLSLQRLNRAFSQFKQNN